MTVATKATSKQPSADISAVKAASKMFMLHGVADSKPRFMLTVCPAVLHHLLCALTV
jgi:hypothetical protein